MMIIGLLLMAAAVVAGTGVVIGNTDKTSFDVFNVEFVNLSEAGIFLLGAATGAVLLIGLWMMGAGLRKSRRRRLEVKQARREREEVLRQQEEERRDLETERERLAEERARLTDDRTSDRDASHSDGTEPRSRATRVIPGADDRATDERSVQR
jgi:hypothetical protein